MQLIHALSAKALNISVAELADLVQKDMTVMTKVIAAANTLGYNPSGVPIATVTQAIQVIGFERIQSLAMSLMFIRHAENTQNAEEQRATAMLALSSGLVAQEIAGARFDIDPELAFVAASLRNFGRLLITAFMMKEYEEAKVLARDMPDDEAYRQVFGLTPLELGRELLSSSNLPPLILETLRECDPRTLDTMRSADAQLLAVAEFSVQICQLAMNRSVNLAEFERDSRHLVERFKGHLTFAPEEVSSLLNYTSERLNQFTRCFGVAGFARDIVNVLRRRSQHQEPTLSHLHSLTRSDPAAMPPKRRTSPAPLPAKDATPAQKTPEPASAAALDAHPPLPKTEAPAASPVVLDAQIWTDALKQVTRELGLPDVDLPRVQQLVLEAVRRGFDASEAMLFLPERDQRQYSAVQGRGRVFQEIRGERAVRSDDNSVFGICLRRRENVVIHNTSDPKIAAHVPHWCAAGRGLGAFVAMPLHDTSGCFALIVVGWLEPRQIPITPEHSSLLRSLLALVGAARRQAALLH